MLSITALSEPFPKQPMMLAYVHLFCRYWFAVLVQCHTKGHAKILF